nr:hypothetical protein [Tanacetum cinerariifolium]
MNNSVTIAYRFEITLRLCFFDGSKPGFVDELQESSIKTFKNTSNFDSNGGDDCVTNGGLDQRDITFVDSIYGAMFATNSSSLMKPIQMSQVVLVDIPENLAENDSIVVEHGLSLKKSLRAQVGAQIRVRVLKTIGASRIVEDQMKKTLKTEHSPRREALRLHMFEYPPESSGIHKESIQYKKDINEEMVSLEKNQTCSLVRLPAGKKASQSLWMFKVKE